MNIYTLLVLSLAERKIQSLTVASAIFAIPAEQLCSGRLRLAPLRTAGCRPVLRCRPRPFPPRPHECPYQGTPPVPVARVLLAGCAGSCCCSGRTFSGKWAKDAARNSGLSHGREQEAGIGLTARAAPR